MPIERLGKYEIIAKIGAGGMGEVFKAFDPALNREVAIKTIAADSGTDDEMRKRFRREAQSAGRLNHPNIITVYDFGEEQGRMYIAMELLEGSDLKELITGRAPMSLEAQLGLMEQICDGLAFAHARDVVHRDLKPANIHISPLQQVKIMDFGLARVSTSDMTRAGTMLGTPSYMAPEQVKGHKVDARSDVFALGAVFYELLSARKAFAADSMTAVMFQVMQSEPPPLATLRPELPALLCEVVHKALAKDPNQRYTDAGELREGLREVRAALGPVMARNRDPPSQSGSAAPTLKDSPASRTLSHQTPTPASAATTPAMAHPTLAIHSSPPAQVAPTARAATASAQSPAPETTRIDDGNTRVPPTLSGGAPTQLTVRAASPATTAVPPPISRSARPDVQGSAAPIPSRPVSPILIAAASLLAIGVVALAWRFTHTQPSAGGSVVPLPVTPPAVSETVPAVPALDSALHALQKRDYRGAAALSQEILAVEPQNAGARSVLDQAQRALTEIEVVASRVKQSLDAGDSQAASRMLATLGALDPKGPKTQALTARLGDVQKAQAQEARRGMERAQLEAQARASSTDRAAPSAVGLQPPVMPSTQPVTPPVSLAHPPTAQPGTAPSVGLASPPPVTVPPAQLQAAAKQAIRGVLDEYRASFERRDADALRAVQPGVDYDRIKDTFAKVTGYSVRIDVKEIDVAGDHGTGTAKCVVSYSPIPKPSGKLQPVVTLFHLRKTGQLWLIERLEQVR